MTGSDQGEVERVETARCPRCGYDLRGQIGTWTDACPLEGTCTECGLKVSWPEVLLPEKFEPRWCIEFAPRWRVPVAAARTFLGSLRPWRFWSRLRMSQRVRWPRLALYMVLLLASLLLPYVVVQGSAAAFVRWMVGQQLRDFQQQLPSDLQYLQSLKDDPASNPRLSRDQTEEQRQSYLLMIDQQIAQIQQAIASPPVIDHSYPEAVIEAIVFPAATSSWGSIGRGGAFQSPYPAPTEIWIWVDATVGSSSAWSGAMLEMMVEPASLVGISVLLMLVFPLTLALLPASRRRAKVRWWHIARVTAYGFFIPVVVILAGAAYAGAGIILGLGWSDTPLLLIAGIGPPVLLIVWWTAAIGRYLKIPHGFAVAALHTVLAAGLLLALFWAINQQLVASRL